MKGMQLALVDVGKQLNEREDSQDSVLKVKVYSIYYYHIFFVIRPVSFNNGILSLYDSIFTDDFILVISFKQYDKK